ncbi:type I-E CRISPR-associated protein Cse1/CasA [Salinifilum ghardaiensis]
MSTFDLLTEPWLPVVTCDGKTDEVSLREAFTRAHELRWLEGESPVVTAALHRMLLAFAHRCYGPKDDAAWERLWKASSLHENEQDEQAFEEYVERFSDRFDLFHPERPFMQAPGLREKAPGSVSQLLPHRATGNNATLFDHTTSDEHVAISPAQAARWLVTLQAFDAGGMKTPYRTDKSSEAGLANRFATTLVEGSTLHETLVLNMPLYHPDAGYPEPSFPEDCPVWELDDPPGPEPDQQGRAPYGWTDVLTWPSRRVLLHPTRTEQGLRVDGAVITPGTRLRTELPKSELMAAFRYRTKKRGKNIVKEGPAQPVVLEELRGVWRHARELLLGDGEDAHRERPRTLAHLAERAGDELLSRESVYTLRVFGQQLNSQGGAVHAWQQETLPAPVALLRADPRNDAVGELLGLAVGLADDVGDALKRLERDCTAALSGENPSQRRLLAQWYWPRLSEPFADLLRASGRALNLDDRGQRQRALFDALDQWREDVRRTAKKAADRWAGNVPRGDARHLQALAQSMNDFEGLLIWLCKQFDARTGQYYDPNDEDEDEDG